MICKIQLIRYDQQAKQQCSTTLATMPKEVLQLPKGPPHMSRTCTAIADDRRPTRLSLTLPKLHLATFNRLHVVDGSWLRPKLGISVFVN